MTGASLRAWRISVNWSMDQTARALGYASSSTVAKWETEDEPIPTLAQLAIRWLMHVTPRQIIGVQLPPARPKRRLWTTREIKALTGFDSSPAGAIIEMAIKLGRSESSISQKLAELRRKGLAPKYDQTGRRRGAKPPRRGPPPLAATLAPARPVSIMSDGWR